MVRGRKGPGFGAGDQVEDLGHVVGAEPYGLGVGLARAGRCPTSWTPCPVPTTSQPSGASVTPGTEAVRAGADERGEVGPGARVVGVVGDGGEGSHVRVIAGGLADAFGEVGVRAGERGPGGVVQDVRGAGVGGGDGHGVTVAGVRLGVSAGLTPPRGGGGVRGAPWSGVVERQAGRVDLGRLATASLERL